MTQETQIFWPASVTLTGQNVTLVPTEVSHAPALAACVGDLHELWYTFIPKAEDMQAEVERRLAEKAKGKLAPFTVCTPDGTPVGMTTYMHIDAGSKRLEIGSTWMAKDVQRKGMNTEAKLLLLTHAFEELACIAVEFRTHRLNGQSRAAIERLGAQLDGILRAHMVMPNGTIRDTAAYSITAPEWPAIKAGLLGKMNR